MAEHTPVLHTFTFDDIEVRLNLPVLVELQQSTQQLGTSANQPFPFWAKLWPSALAMCRFLVDNRDIIAGRKVLELAAGLGLPGLVAAHFAAAVTISDYLPEAVTKMEAAIVLNDLNNISARLLDWYRLPETLAPDVLLMSDVNYDPEAFGILYKVLAHFLEKDVTIVLATPQRLMAKPFIEQLLPFCIRQEELDIVENTEPVYISLFILKKKT